MAVKIPQNVEREDRIVGPLTLKQLLWTVGGAGVVIGVVRYWMAGYLYLTEMILLSFLFGGLALLFAFFKFNEMSFASLLLTLIRFLLAPKRWVWQRSIEAAPEPALTAGEKGLVPVTLEQKDEERRSELEKLSLILDTSRGETELGERIAALPVKAAERIEMVEELEDVLEKVA